MFHIGFKILDLSRKSKVESQKQFCTLHLFNSQQFNGEDEGSVRRNAATGTLLAIPQLVRDIEFVFRADGHELQPFGPTFDYLVQSELNRFATAVTAVEHGAVDERTFVVHLDRVGGFGFLPEGGFQYLVLKSARSRFYFCALGVVL